VIPTKPRVRVKAPTERTVLQFRVLDTNGDRGPTLDPGCLAQLERSRERMNELGVKAVGICFVGSDGAIHRGFHIAAHETVFELAGAASWLELAILQQED
jgi:hypothetical protein